MLENEFEKKVQQHLEEFRLRPSDEVWTNVEKELREKKRRRVVFFFFLAAGLGLLGYSGYTLWDGHAKTLASANKGTPASVKPVIVNKDNTVSYSSPVIKVDQSPEDEPVIPSASNEQKVAAGNSITYNHKPANAASSNLFETTIDAPVIAQEQQGVKEGQVKPVPSPQETGINKNEQIAETKVLPSSTDAAKKNNIVKTDSVVISATSETKEKPSKKKKYPVIKWGSDLSAGMAFSRGGIFSLSPGPGSLNDALASAINSPAVNNRLRRPSSPQPGLSVKAGIDMKMEVSPKSSFITGLRYAYFSERIKVGSNRSVVFIPSGALYASNASPRVVYNGTTQESYVNRYHFLELPLLYQLQLNKGKKLPVNWNAGISVSYLLSTNALVYDTAIGGIYYKDRNAFTKFHAGLQTGFSVQLGNKKNIQWSVGPEFSFDLSRQMKQNVFTDKRYLFYGGITGRMFFDRKKK